MFRFPVGQESDKVNQTETLKGSNFVLNVSWWNNSRLFSMSRAKFFWLAAVALTVSNLLAVAANEFLKEILTMQELDTDVLLRVTLMVFGALVVSLLVGFWSLYVWFAGLIAFSQAWFNRDSEPPSQLQKLYELLTKEKKGHLRSLSLWTSLFLLPPAIPLSAMIAANIVNNPQFTLFGQRVFILPSWSTAPLIIGIAALSLVTMAYILMAIAIAGAAEQLSGREVAIKAYLLCLKELPAVCLVSCVVALMNILITAPQLIFLCTPLSVVLNDSVWLNVLLQIWFGITSLAIWPMSVLPFCQLVQWHRSNLSS